MFCTNCGSQIDPGMKFCVQCGFPVSPNHAPGEAKPRKASSKKWILPVFLSLGGLALLITIIALIFGGNGGRMKLGKTTALAVQTLPATGGTVTVGASGSDVAGLTLTVPDGAYPESLEYKIRETEIKSHPFGDIFTPITPLITIENGHGFAETPMLLTIPIRLAAGEFAMAFFYDPATGQLEGIPTAELTSSSITVLTCHFSDIVVSKVTESVLNGRIQNNEAVSGFLPKVDDFAAVNLGSHLCPPGHCGGQSIAMMHYYTVNSVKAQTGSTLRKEKAVDNNSDDETPAFWLDDSAAYRLCSVMQEQYLANWDQNLNQVKSNLWLREDITYYSFAYAINLTGSPQFIDIRGKDALSVWHAHCMVVYQVTPEGLFIADPNHPGDLTRRITSTTLAAADANGSRIDLSAYYSGDTGTSDQMTYGNFAYMGTYALVDYTTVDDLWSEVLNGGDVGIGVFMADELFLTISLDPSGAQKVDTLSGNHTISSKDAAVIDPANPNAIYITVPVSTPEENLTFYRGTEELGSVTSPGNDVSSWAIIQLLPGVNDIGIYQTVDGLYVNFYRFAITLTDGTVSSSAASSETSASSSAGPTPSPSPEITSAAASAEYDFDAALAAWKAAYVSNANKTYDDNVSTDTYTLQWVVEPSISGDGIVGANVVWRHTVYKDGRPNPADWIEVYQFDAQNPGVYLSLAELQAAFPQFWH